MPCTIALMLRFRGVVTPELPGGMRGVLPLSLDVAKTAMDSYSSGGALLMWIPDELVLPLLLLLLQDHGVHIFHRGGRRRRDLRSASTIRGGVRVRAGLQGTAPDRLHGASERIGVARTRCQAAVASVSHHRCQCVDHRITAHQKNPRWYNQSTINPRPLWINRFV